MKHKSKNLRSKKRKYFNIGDNKLEEYDGGQDYQDDNDIASEDNYLQPQISQHSYPSLNSYLNCGNGGKLLENVFHSKVLNLK